MAKLSDIDLSLLDKLQALVVGNLTRADLELKLCGPLFGADSLKRSGYGEHFEWQLLRTADKSLTLKPSACFSVYDEIEGSDLAEPHEALVCAPVYRTESKSNSSDGRYNGFWMFEYVVVGDREYVETKAESLLSKVGIIFDELGLKVKAQNSTDAFFLGESRGSKLLQQLKGLKTEFVYGKHDLSLGSLNRHEDYFGKRYKITSAGKPAHSLCLAFGVDRISDAINGRVS